MESVYKALFEAAPQALLVVRATAGFEIVFVNARFEQATGARRDDLLGRALFAALHDHDGDLALGPADALRASLERALGQDAPDNRGLSEIRLPDGRGGFSLRVVKRVTIAVPDEAGRPAFILHQIEDVTDLVRPAAESEPGRDPVALPRARDAKAPPTPPRIVVACADAKICGDLAALLAASGFEPLLAADAEAAVAACLDASPALLLSEASALGIDGLALTRRLRGDERTATLPIMLLSDRAGEAARIESYDAGADEIMEMPFAERELIARIEAAVKLSGARAEFADRQRRFAVLTRLASVVETAMDAVISIDARQKIILFNAAAEQMFGCKAEDALGQPLDAFIPQRFRASHAKHVETFARTGVSGRTMGRLGDLMALRADGVEFPIEASISQARVDDELLFTVILRDISERKAAAEMQRVLIGELDHRVKNTLAMVQAIANHTAKTYADPKIFVQSFKARVQAMASAHNLLTQAGWKGADLGDLIRQQLTLGPEESDSRILSLGPKVYLTPRLAMHFGMVLYELGANARKYGSLSGGEGRLDINWRVDATDAEELLTFGWVESGGPPIRPQIEKHFGTRLIESSLTHSLQGKVELDFAETGLVCKISLPLGHSIA
jgi:PAS domain S-box-containing protein